MPRAMRRRGARSSLSPLRDLHLLVPQLPHIVGDPAHAAETVWVCGPWRSETRARGAGGGSATPGLAILAAADERGLHETARTAVGPALRRAGGGGAAAAPSGAQRGRAALPAAGAPDSRHGRPIARAPGRLGRGFEAARPERARLADPSDMRDL